MCKRSQKGSLPGICSVPGGHLEKGEKIEEGAIREFREETGLQIIDNLDYVATLNGGSRSKYYLFMYEIGRKVDIDLDEARDGHEHTECGWFKKENLPEDTEKQLFFVINETF